MHQGSDGSYGHNLIYFVCGFMCAQILLKGIHGVLCPMMLRCKMIQHEVVVQQGWQCIMELFESVWESGSVV